MRSLIATTLAIALMAFAAPPTEYQISADESEMTVSGTSSLHDWSCPVNDLSGSFTSEGATTAVPPVSAATISVTIADIDCGKRVMDNKLRDALKGKDHPHITFTLESLVPEGDSWNVTGSLAVAGATHTVTFPVAANFSDGAYRFQGEVKLSLEGMGLERPSALLGTVKTGDEVTVAFNVVAR